MTPKESPEERPLSHKPKKETTEVNDEGPKAATAACPECGTPLESEGRWQMCFAEGCSLIMLDALDPSFIIREGDEFTVERHLTTERANDPDSDFLR